MVLAGYGQLFCAETIVGYSDCYQGRQLGEVGGCGTYAVPNNLPTT